MQFVIELIKNSKEWHSFGINTLTVSFFGTLFFTLLQTWGLWSQHRKIRANHFGGAVSISLFAYYTFGTLTFLCYGIITSNLAIIFNGFLLGVLYLFVLWDLILFKKFTNNEKLIAIGSFLFIPAIIFLPWKDLVLTTGMVISMIPLSMQPLEMWRKKSAMSVEIRFIATSAIANIFWMIYGISVRSIPLSVMNPISLAILTITATLWFRYKRALREVHTS
jgi:uncharacterized protein with PQ loop repeat